MNVNSIEASSVTELILATFEKFPIAEYEKVCCYFYPNSPFH